MHVLPKKPFVAGVTVGLLSLVLATCRPMPTEPAPSAPAITRGIYVLNEGLFQRNNSTLTFYSLDSNKATTDFFELINRRTLGDTGNDLLMLRDKLYVLVNVSSKIEVLDARSGRALATIPLFNSNVARQPREMLLVGGRLFVTCFDGTVCVIDTARLVVTSVIRVGRHPEGLAFQNGKIYVANSGGLDFPNYDSTVSVIDPISLREIKRIPLRINPGAVVADKEGDVYVISRGNYQDVPSRLMIIDSRTDQVKATLPFEIDRICLKGDTAYIARRNTISLFDTRLERIVRENFIDASNFRLLYAIEVDESTGDLYGCDAINYVVRGEVICFDREGRRKFSFQAGINPSSIAFLR
ncbi:MAG: YncE family protein [Chloroherpetonaceae bacterium]|nr:YncE family protein [Chloroherpetonaceae bacterium]MCS7210447.1 YncE family protein [Chloroherpetonaceae bacterium]MDW8018862.1 YncE family protein [Chloroherpetonaceae bacterium]MDW8466694.1 YncE family protein [Chloroherpetonaceae bacterium]